MTVPLMRPIRTENEDKLLEAAKAVLAACEYVRITQRRDVPLSAAIFRLTEFDDSVTALRLAVAQARGEGQ